MIHIRCGKAYQLPLGRSQNTLLRIIDSPNDDKPRNPARKAVSLLPILS